ncbi:MULTISPECIES: uracil-DNA glycosylase [Thermoanaerobacter]|uniref:Type-4 uracil-DNA glycosylase n=2 Tax=Thermoanaerobacter TaxID=1754 RepID=B0K7X1_THEP3|nr:MULTISPECIES: uracil-DNA glycosylase [Thermoanaerobacter]ABY95791.1 phage SPO1 DNA polymerase-related protein [Thermoanaerobacter pseudethanolicus ATCC 33223]ADV80721.1 phage SPO1 DNA polymerase-related protein [Thermoanaerobacter brockii subsp. finnii Ako-1]HBW59180.1 uracil-DNA glycosylase [Thermoanaerobacter sp.]
MALLPLKELYLECLHCTKCDLSKTKTNMVFGEGNLRAKVMFVGEGPGRDEDLQGRPFVGRAGQFLNKMLEDVGLKREEVYIANIVKCRPPNNRVPLQSEIDACLPYLRNQVAIIAPKMIVCLGATAAKAIIDKNFKITVMRGQWFERKGVKIIATYHPAAILRDPEKLEPAMEDFKKIKEELDKLL